MKVTMNMKSAFFDKPAVIRAVDRAKRDALSEVGAHIRLTAQKSMEASKKSGLLKESDLPSDLRERRKRANKIRVSMGQPRLKRLNLPSKPGQPPAAGRSSPLNKRLLFAYDATSDSVIVGPEKNKYRGIVPDLLERGGTTVVTRRVKGKLVQQRVHIAARPYMRPALDANRSAIPAAFKNSVRKA